MPRLTPEQLSLRSSGIGSSDVAAILGISPYEGDDQWRVYAEKLNLLPPREEDIARRLGHELEIISGKLYTEEFGDVLPGGTLIHPEEPWAFATIDYKHIGLSRGVEMKAVGSWMLRGWDRHRVDGVPQWARVQANWQMWVGSYQEIDISAILGGTDWKVWRVPRDNDLIGHMVAACRKFWFDHVAARIPPPFDGSEHCRTYLLNTYPREESPIILDADDEAEALAGQRIDAQVAEAIAGREKDTATARLLDKVGAASGIKGRGWKLTWKTNAAGKRVTRFTVKGDRPKGASDGED